jgi:hypothetical protein
MVRLSLFWLVFLMTSTVSAAVEEPGDTINGLGRVEIANTVGCLARNASWLAYVPQVIAAKGDRAALLGALEQVNTGLPAALQDTSEALQAEADALHADPPVSLARYSGLRMERCADRFQIPLNRAMAGRCYEVVSFMNAMRLSHGKAQTPEAFADTWVPMIARSEQDLERLRPAIIQQFGSGSMPFTKELGLYLACATKKAE